MYAGKVKCGKVEKGINQLTSLQVDKGDKVASGKEMNSLPRRGEECNTERNENLPVQRKSLRVITRLNDVSMLEKLNLKYGLERTEFYNTSKLSFDPVLIES